MKYVAGACALVFLVFPSVRAENGVRPGRFLVHPPTLICLGFQWDISGDDNRNASVEVSYRAADTSAWKEALPLLRIGGERIFRAPYTVPDGFPAASSTSSPAPITRSG
jgi:hypothetical protein